MDVLFPPRTFWADPVGNLERVCFMQFGIRRTRHAYPGGSMLLPPSVLVVSFLLLSCSEIDASGV